MRCTRENSLLVTHQQRPMGRLRVALTRCLKLRIQGGQARIGS